MTSLRWLSLALFVAGSLGFADSADADKKSKRDKEDKVEDVVEPALEEEEEAALEEPSVEETMSDQEPQARVGTAGYDGGFYIGDSGDHPNRLRINGRVKSRFSFFSDETGADRANQHAFSVPIARLALRGNVYDERVFFKTEIGFEKGITSLKDFFIDYRLGKGQTRVRMGQFKKPFSRQNLTSDGNLEFVTRSIVDGYFDNGRDLGIQLHSGFVDQGEIEWALGVFNGTGEAGVFQPEVVVDPMTMESEVVGGSFSNIPEKVRPAVVARVGLNADEINGYSEADLEGGDLRYAIAAASMTYFRLGGNSAVGRNGVDFVVKQDGFSATGGIYAEMQGPKVADLEYSALGGYVQTGYVVDREYQPALRYSLITQKGGNSVQEISAVFSVYRFGHGLKWQSEGTLLNTDDGARRKDYRFRTQVHLAF